MYYDRQTKRSCSSVPCGKTDIPIIRTVSLVSVLKSFGFRSFQRMNPDIPSYQCSKRRQGRTASDIGGQRHKSPPEALWET